MRWKNVFIVTSLMLFASSGWAETYVPRTGTTLRFDQSQQKHPKRLTVAIPIMGPVVGVDGGPLSFSAMYRTFFRREEDPRNSRGKVILKIEVIRNDQVIWEGKKKSRVKYDRYTYWECGNCTHRLDFCNELNSSLQEGDLVLFQFKFKKMPRFETGESAEFGGEVYVTDGCE